MPAATKQDCQPNRYAIHGMMAGAISAPALVPALKMLVANARSRFGNQSATALIAEGKLPASPRPSAERAVMNPPKLPTTPDLKMLVANARPRFGNQSATALIAEGKLPASPRPSAERAVMNPPKLPTSP